MELSTPLMLVIIGISSLAAQWLAWRLRIPAILPLLIMGIALGPLTHVVNPDALFGELLFHSSLSQSLSSYLKVR